MVNFSSMRTSGLRLLATWYLLNKKFQIHLCIVFNFEIELDLEVMESNSVHTDKYQKCRLFFQSLWFCQKCSHTTTRFFYRMRGKKLKKCTFLFSLQSKSLSSFHFFALSLMWFHLAHDIAFNMCGSFIFKLVQLQKEKNYSHCLKITKEVSLLSKASYNYYFMSDFNNNYSMQKLGS